MNFLKSIFGNKTENEGEKRVEDKQKNFEALKYDGVIALKTNEIEHALRCFSYALDLKNDAETRDYYSQALIRNNQMTEAYHQLQLLTEAEPDNWHIYMRMADVAYMMENYDEMALSCQKAMQIEPENAHILYTYAKACLGKNNPTNAITMLTKAVETDKNAYEAYLLRGETHLDMDHVALADEDATYLLSQVEDSEEALILKARVERKKGNTVEAISYYDRVIAVNPFSSAAFQERGELFIAVGNEQRGNEDIAAAQELTAQLSVHATDDEAQDGIEQQVKQAYQNTDVYGVFGNL